MKKNTEYLVLLSFQLSLRYNHNYLISKELREWMMLQLQVKNSFDGMKIGANADHNTFFVRIY